MKYTWLVEQYLEGELSGEALQKFELDILRKPEVAKEVERIRSLNRFLKKQHHKLEGSGGLIEDFDDLENILPEEEVGHQLEDLKIRKISSSHNDITDLKSKIEEARMADTLRKSPGNKIQVKKISVWLTAASLTLLVATSLVLLIGRQKTDYTVLYQQFYTPRAADVERSVPQNRQDPYRQALIAYSQADYALAFRLLNSIPEKGVSNHYYLYKGIVAMELGKYPIAIEMFNKLDQDVNLKHEGMWYKSLSYLAMEDGEAARRTLKEIIRTEGYYKNRASALLRKI